MALQNTILKNDIITLLTTLKAKEVGAATSVEEFAEGLTNAIHNYVLSGQVNTIVATTGTSAAQTGTGVGNIT